MHWPTKVRVRIFAACVALAAVVAAIAGMSSASTAATTSPADPSGQAMPTGDAPGWHQVFSDNFAGSVPLGRFPAAVAPQWGRSYANGWRDTTKHGVYMPTRVVSIADGMMRIHVHTEHRVHMVAAVVPTIRGSHSGGGGLLYGRYVIRMRADAVAGYKVAVLLWPDNGRWPASGEIDFPETEFRRTVFAWVHHQGAVSGVDQTGFRTRTSLSGWHTLALTWLKNRVTFQIDGRVIGTTRVRIPSTPMHFVIQTETNPGSPPPSSASGNLEIDWIAVYTPACNRAMSIAPRRAACA